MPDSESKRLERSFVWWRKGENDKRSTKKTIWRNAEASDGKWDSFMGRLQGASRQKCGHRFLTVTSENCSQDMATVVLWKQAYTPRPRLYPPAGWGHRSALVVNLSAVTEPAWVPTAAGCSSLTPEQKRLGDWLWEYICILSSTV